MKVIKLIKILGVSTFLALGGVGEVSAMTEMHFDIMNRENGESVIPLFDAESWSFMALGLGLVLLRLCNKRKRINCLIYRIANHLFLKVN